jgi:type I restriction enzyme, S subunit
MKDLKQIEQYASYPKYKDTGIEWLGKIPEHWNVIKNKYIWKEKKDINQSEEEAILSVSQYTGVMPKEKIVDQGDFLTRAESLIGMKVVEKNNLVINTMLAWNGSLGVSNYRGVVSSSYNVYEPIDINYVFPNYFHYLLRTQNAKEEFKRYSTGIIDSRLRLYPEEFLNLYSVLPPMEEQKKIAEFLDFKMSQIDYIIKDKERLIELLQEQRQAIINEAVTKGLSPETTKMKDSGIDWIGEIPENWEVKRLKWVVSRVGSGKTPKGGAEVYKDSGVIFIRSQNVHFEGLRLDDVVYIDEKIDEEMKSSRVQPEDILLNITGASLGRCCLVPDKFPASNVNQHVCIIRPIKDKIYPQFLNLIISSNFVQKQIFESENGISREGLNFQQIKNLILIVPPINEQILISKTLENKTKQIDDLVTQFNKHIEKISEYRQSLIKEAVTGKIDVRGFRKGE